MKILGCFKIVPDLDFIAQEDWMADGQLQVDTSYAKLLWNCFDEGALEMMLKLSDLSEGFDVVYELNALTVGRLRHETFLKTLYALGFSHAVRVEAEEDVDLRFCPGLIADVTAKYVKETASQDVIVMGTQSSDGSNMKTPLLLAERLGWPCITQVTALEPVDEKHLRVRWKDGGTGCNGSRRAGGRKCALCLLKGTYAERQDEVWEKVDRAYQPGQGTGGKPEPECRAYGTGADR